MWKRKLPAKYLNHPVAQICDIREDDTRISAARKAVKMMRLIGCSPEAIMKTNGMIAAAIKRGVK